MSTKYLFDTIYATLDSEVAGKYVAQSVNEMDILQVNKGKFIQLVQEINGVRL